MRRAILTPILVVALVLGLGSAARSEAAFYLGGGEGIRVAFRVKGHRLVWASVFVRLYCVRPEGKRHFNRAKQSYATPDYPWRLTRHGTFRWDTRGLRQEQGFTLEDFIAGRVGEEFVTGRYYYERGFTLRRRMVDCRTGSYPFSQGESEVPFRARLQPGHR